MTTPAQSDSAQQVQDALAAPQQQQTQTDPAQQTQQVQQPAATQQQSQVPYANELASLPEAVRPLVEPIFKQWDANVTQRQQELHSQYEPWKPVMEFGDPDTVQGALQVAQVLENDPARFIGAFAQAYPDIFQEVIGNLQPQQQQTSNGSGEQGLGDLDPDDPIVKRLASLEQMVQQAVGGFTGFTEQQQAQENQRILDQTLADLHTKHGEFDDEYVLAKMAYANKTPEQAVQEYVAKFGATQQTQQQTTQTSAPNVLTPGGGLPANPISVDQLAGDDKATRALVAGLLDAANQQNNQ